MLLHGARGQEQDLRDLPFGVPRREQPRHVDLLIANTPTGLHGIDDRGAIKLPATLRRLCNITYGPPLVLAAAVPKQVMVVHPGIVVADMLASHYTHLIQSEQPAAMATGRKLEEGTS